MDEELEKRLFVYRRSCKFYGNLSNCLFLSKFVFSASGLSAFALLPLASLSLGAVIIEIIEKHLRVADRKAEYKTTYSFYLELLAMFRSGELSEDEVLKRENELRKSLQFFPREKYMKLVKLNGYKYCTSSVKLK